MAQQQFLASLSGTLNYVNSAGTTLTLTGVGATKYTTGHVAGQQAAIFEEEGVNLLTNPSLETNTDNWYSFSTATISRITTGGGASGSCFLRVACPKTGDNEGFLAAAPLSGASDGRSFTVSVHLRGATVGGTLRGLYARLFYTDNSYTDGLTLDLPVTTAWPRFSSTVTAVAGKTLLRMEIIGVRNAAAAETSAWTFDVDAAQVEEKTYMTSYVDGSLGTGYAWSGTAHASWSVRYGARATLTNGADAFPAFPFEAVCKYQEQGHSAFNVNGGWLWLVGNWSDSFLGLIRQRSGYLMVYYFGPSGSGASTTLTSATQWSTRLGWHTVGVFMSGTRLELYVDGVLEASTTGTFPAFNFAGKNGLFLGGDAGMNVNMPFGPFQAFNAEQNRPTKVLLSGNTVWSYNMALPQGTGASAHLIGL